MADLAKVKRNVSKMVGMEAPEADIDAYISSEGSSVEEIRAFVPTPQDTGLVEPEVGLLDQQRKRGAESASLDVAAEAEEITRPEAQVRKLGEFAGGVTDVIGEGATTAFHALMTDKGEEKLSADLQKLAATPVGQAGIEAIQKGGELYGEFKAENPRVAGLLEAGVNIVSLIPLVKGLTSGIKSIATSSPEGVIKQLPEAVAQVGNKAADVAVGIAPVKRLVKGRDADNVLASRLSVGDAKEALGKIKGGEILNLADVAGDEIKGLTRAIAKEKGGARNIVKAALEERNAGALGRVTQALSKDISDVDSYFGNLDDVGKARAVASRPLYKEAFATGKQLRPTTRLNTLLNDQRISSAIDEAKSNLGITLEAPRNSLETLNGAKRILDDRWRVATRAGETEKAGAIQGLKKELLKELDAQVPKYKEARAVFSDFASLEDMQVFGRSFDKQTPEQLRLFMKDLSNTDKEAFKIGVRENMMIRVMKAGDTANADVAARIFGSGREGGLKREQIKAIFGEGEQFDSFARKMAEETAAVETKFSVLGGSRTDFNITDDGGFLAQAAEQAAQKGVTRTLVDASADAIKRRWIGLNPKSAKDLAVILTDKNAGIEALERLIANAPKSQKSIVKDAVEELKTIKPK